MYRLYRKIFEIKDKVFSKIRIFHLSLKYPGLKIQGDTTIERNCKIVCVDGGILTLKDTHISEGTYIIAAQNAMIQISNSFIGRNCLLSANKEIIIKNDCLIAEMVVVRDHNHNYTLSDELTSSQGNDIGSIYIENNVWIGTKSTVLKGVTIGKNAVVGAHSLVNSNLESNSVNVGVPAKNIKKG
ncbi:MAG: acyltransferase [Flavobacteriales bacterium]|nr:acyltransferase [Flavobacteriales bacterium]